MMRSKFILISLVASISFLSLMLLVVLPATSQEVTLGDGLLNSTGGKFTSFSDHSIESPLAGTQISTKTIEAYIPFQEYRYHRAVKVTGMSGGTYTWRLENFPPDTLSDVFFDWIGGSGCIQQPNNNIVCGNGISYFYVEFRYTSTYSPTSNLIAIDAGSGASGFSPDHTATLNYIDPLIFITSTLRSSGTPIEPLSHSNATLKWQIPNSGDGWISATFYDPRISIVYLPVLIK
jgi:hypothetical protein